MAVIKSNRKRNEIVVDLRSNSDFNSNKNTKNVDNKDVTGTISKAVTENLYKEKK